MTTMAGAALAERWARRAAGLEADAARVGMTVDMRVRMDAVARALRTCAMELRGELVQSSAERARARARNGMRLVVEHEFGDGDSA